MNVALNTCDLIILLTARGTTRVIRRIQPSLVNGRFDCLVRWAMPREVCLRPRGDAGRGETCASLRASLWGVPVVIKYGHGESETTDADGDAIKLEYKQLKESKTVDPERFASLPIPSYYGVFSAVSLENPDEDNNEDEDGGTRGLQFLDMLVMSDNGRPVEDAEVKERFA